ARRREAGEKWAGDQTLSSLAQVAAAQGDYVQAREYFEQYVALRQQLGHAPGAIARAIWPVLATMGHMARYRGDYEQAASLYRESLALRQQAQDTLAIAQSLEDFACLAARQQQWQRTARLLGAAEAVCAGVPATAPVANAEEYEAAV